MTSGNDDIAALISATAAGDRQALKELYDRTAPRLLAIALRIIGRRDLAEDALQETFLTIWEKARTYTPERGTGMAWLATLARRRAVDRLRASPWLMREAADVEAALDAPAQEMAIADAVALNRCLGELDAATRRAIRLAYMYGMSHREIRNALTEPLGTVKSRIRRGLLALKECLER